jgi:hypothetical protein
VLGKYQISYFKKQVAFSYKLPLKQSYNIAIVIVDNFFYLNKKKQEYISNFSYLQVKLVSYCHCPFSMVQVCIFIYLF